VDYSKQSAYNALKVGLLPKDKRVTGNDDAPGASALLLALIRYALL
jgi:hypothetical protein